MLILPGFNARRKLGKGNKKPYGLKNSDTQNVNLTHSDYCLKLSLEQ